jgi:hypothetical protein
MDHPNVVKIYQILNFSNFLIISMSLGLEPVSEFTSRRFREGSPLTELECSQLA